MKNQLMKAVAASALTALGLVASSGAQAALVSRLGGKAFYDNVADLTWLQDANFAKTSGFIGDGALIWNDANFWAGSLNIGGVTGWRLPGGPMASGFNQTASEMGNLFHNVLGGVAFTSIGTNHNANYDLFSNVQPFAYWSGVEFDSSRAWVFAFGNGFQVNLAKTGRTLAWAVHTGDVGAVPLPGALLLMGPAMLGLLGLGRSQRRGCP